MNPENIMLSDISQIKGQILYDSTLVVSKIGKFKEAETRLEVTRSWGRERQRPPTNGCEVSFRRG